MYSKMWIPWGIISLSPCQASQWWVQAFIPQESHFSVIHRPQVIAAPPHFLSDQDVGCESKDNAIVFRLSP